MSERKGIPIEAQEIKLPRVKRIKKLIDAEQLSQFFSQDFTGSVDDPNGGEREHYMQLYALMAAFDADITREAFADLAVDILNMRARSATCYALQMAAVNQQSAHLTPELLVKSHTANRAGVNADAAEISRQLSLIAECRGQEDQVH